MSADRFEASQCSRYNRCNRCNRLECRPTRVALCTARNRCTESRAPTCNTLMGIHKILMLRPFNQPSGRRLARSINSAEWPQLAQRLQLGFGQPIESAQSNPMPTKRWAFPRPLALCSAKLRHTHRWLGSRPTTGVRQPATDNIGSARLRRRAIGAREICSTETRPLGSRRNQKTEPNKPGACLAGPDQATLASRTEAAHCFGRLLIWLATRNSIGPKSSCKQPTKPWLGLGLGGFCARLSLAKLSAPKRKQLRIVCEPLGASGGGGGGGQSVCEFRLASMFDGAFVDVVMQA